MKRRQRKETERKTQIENFHVHKATKRKKWNKMAERKKRRTEGNTEICRK